ncbi:ACT domain-containing protein [Alexandriicola marinus]|uniref:ACT domain-containing protein n=1 Tax=Alexandriicola marinus TaxID=2081710 RepID=UPI001F0BB4ED|nr:ACT domain-containing protein [Alexandriicola marinus]
MSGPARPIRDTHDMIAGMSPVRRPGTWVFVTSDDPKLRAEAIATIREPEGLSLIVPAELAPGGLEMAQITLQVHSALDGVGLTAAVATALADAGIPCNMVAGHHHDHAFVPAERGDEALMILEARAAASD